MLPRQAQEQGLIADVVILADRPVSAVRKRDKSQVNIALGNLELLVMDAHFVRLHDDAGETDGGRQGMWQQTYQGRAPEKR